YQHEVEQRQRIVVGVNRYVHEDEEPLEILRIDPALEAKQIGRVQALRAGRDSAKVEAALARLKEDAGQEGRNLMNPIVEAAQASAAPAPTLFRLTIVGTAHEEWSFAAAPVPDGACRRTETSEGIRDVKFRTKKPVIVRLSGGRVLPVVVAGLTGTVTLGGA